jgi:hypothetical protein
MRHVVSERAKNPRLAFDFAVQPEENGALD